MERTSCDVPPQSALFCKRSHSQATWKSTHQGSKVLKVVKYRGENLSTARSALSRTYFCVSRVSSLMLKEA